MIKQFTFSLRSAVVIAALIAAGCATNSAPLISLPPLPALPAPPAPPAPPPPSTFDTPEFRGNVGLSEINSLPAYDQGLSGAGEIVAVIDTGIDPMHVDLDDNLHPQSRDVSVSRAQPSVRGPSDHGTKVAGIIAAEKNDIGMHGVAFGAKVLALRADAPGSCQAGNCAIRTDEFVAAIDAAITAGAHVLNLSFPVLDAPPGQTPTPGNVFLPPEMEAALRRAIANDILIVAAAGNNAPGRIPQPFIAQIGLEASISGQILLVGAANRNGNLFAGSSIGDTAQDIYLAAPSEVLTTIFDDQFAQTDFGTSFSAPHVAGAAALLFELFPNLTAKEIGQILLDTARDRGAPGVDNIFGHGLLDLAAAIQPIGNLSINVTAAKNAEPILLNQTIIAGSGPFGDAFSRGLSDVNIVAADELNRFFRTDISATVERPAASPLAIDQILNSTFRNYQSGLALGRRTHATFYWDVSEPFTRDPSSWRRLQAGDTPYREVSLRAVLSTKLAQNIDAHTGFGFSPLSVIDGAGGGGGGELFLLSGGHRRDGFHDLASNINSVAIGKRGANNLRYGAAFSTGNIQGRDTLRGARIEDSEMFSLLAFVRKNTTKANFEASVGMVRESDSLLGARSSGALNLGKGAETFYARVGAQFALPKGFSLFAQASGGATHMRGKSASLVQSAPAISSFTFSARADKSGVIADSDHLTFAISQPLRVESGALKLNIPFSAAADHSSLIFQNRAFSLAPTGRQIDIEFGYSFRTKWGYSLGVNALHRMDPGHMADAIASDAVIFSIQQRR